MSIRGIANQITPKNRQYHLAHSSDIARATICGLKFKLPKIVGVVAPGNESFTSGRLAHDVLERASGRLQNLWRNTASDQEIFNEWMPYMDDVFDEAREKYLASPLDNDIEIYITQAESRLMGLANQLSKKMKRQCPPIRIISEITITNTLARHEGRIDAVFEYENHRETLDWKTYVDKGYSDYDRYQIIANGMLANYRYGDAEDDFTRNELSIITPSGIHHPQPRFNAINDILEARMYILRVSDGERAVRAKLPYRRVCDFCPYHEPCQFYRTDNTNGDIRKLFWSRRFAIGRKRSKTHIYKYLAQSLSPIQMRLLGIAEYGYTLEKIDLNTNSRQYELTLRKDDEDHRLDAGNSVRIIALEPNIHVLACVSCNGSIREVNGTRLLVEVNRGHPYQIQNYSIMLLKSDVDLTRTELRSTDYVHRLPNGSRKKKAALALLGIECDEIGEDK